MKFTSALITAAHAFKKSENLSWSDSLKKAIKKTKAGLIKTITFLKKSGEQTTRFAYLKITDHIEIKGTGKSYNHTTKFIDLKALFQGKFAMRSAITQNILELV